jgi:hypothetical protein
VDYVLQARAEIKNKNPDFLGFKNLPKKDIPIDKVRLGQYNYYRNICCLNYGAR